MNGKRDCQRLRNKGNQSKQDIRINSRNCQRKKRSQSHERQRFMKKINKEFQGAARKHKKQYYNICKDIKDRNRHGKTKFSRCSLNLEGGSNLELVC